MALRFREAGFLAIEVRGFFGGLPRFAGPWSAAMAVLSRSRSLINRESICSLDICSPILTPDDPNSNQGQNAVAGNQRLDCRSQFTTT